MDVEQQEGQGQGDGQGDGQGVGRQVLQHPDFAPSLSLGGFHPPGPLAQTTSFSAPAAFPASIPTPSPNHPDSAISYQVHPKQVWVPWQNTFQETPVYINNWSHPTTAAFW